MKVHGADSVYSGEECKKIHNLSSHFAAPRAPPRSRLYMPFSLRAAAVQSVLLSSLTLAAIGIHALLRNHRTAWPLATVAADTARFALGWYTVSIMLTFFNKFFFAYWGDLGGGAFPLAISASAVCICLRPPAAACSSLHSHCAALRTPKACACQVHMLIKLLASRAIAYTGGCHIPPLPWRGMVQAAESAQ